MRVILSFVLLVGVCTFTVAGERFPYIASITDSETAARSGPGTEFYTTSVLRFGDKVEVYANDETGTWLAVRPPLGSFSLVSGKYVDVNVGNVGTVLADGLAARIGSDRTDLCETVQVKLKKGEKVLVLGRIETPDNEASPVWLKIASPSGEYRWIPRTAVLPPSTRRAAAQQIVQASHREENKEASPPKIAATVPQPPPITISHKNSTESNSVKRTPQIDHSETPAEILPLAKLLAASDPTQNRNGNSDAEIVLSDENQAFNQAFEELKQEARIALTRPTDDWVFETLLKRGNELYEIAPTDNDLEKVYHLVETLQRTRAVRQEIAMKRQFKTGGLLPPAAQAVGSLPRYSMNNGAPAPVPSQPAPALITTASHQTVQPQYDVVGKLGEFKPLPIGHPPYAVVNEKEEIICLVTPAPGLDLRTHIGRTIGINGMLGVYQKRNEPDKRHIMAQEAFEVPTK